MNLCPVSKPTIRWSLFSAYRVLQRTPRQLPLRFLANSLHSDRTLVGLAVDLTSVLLPVGIKHAVTRSLRQCNSMYLRITDGQACPV